MEIKNNKKFYKKRWSWLIALAIVIGVTSSGCSKGEQKVETNAKVVVAATDAAKTETPKIEENKETKKESTNNETVAVNSLKTETAIKGELKVHYIDVGQADSILIQQGSNSMLIDAGNNGDSELVKKYIVDQGVSKLDYIIATHPHEDHIGGLDYVINSLQVGKIYMPKRTSTTKTFEDVVNAIKGKGLKATVPTPGTSFKLGEATCIILAPNGSGYEDPNNESIVIKVSFGGNSFLFTGDAEDVSEKEMLSSGFDLKSDVLKIGHHGSSSSTTQGFLDKVSPKYAVVSVGKDNSYGHPHKDNIDRLKVMNIPVYRTDECGTIVATSNGKDTTFNVRPGSYSYSGTGASTSKTSTPTTTTVNKPQEKLVTPPIVTENKSVTVFITETGKKYHRDGCRYLSKSRIPISLNDAKSGYDPCSVCGPPQ